MRTAPADSDGRATHSEWGLAGSSWGWERFVPITRWNAWDRLARLRSRSKGRPLRPGGAVLGRPGGEPPPTAPALLPPPHPPFLPAIRGPARRRTYRYAGMNEGYREYLTRAGVVDRPVIGRSPSELLPPEFAAQ